MSNIVYKISVFLKLVIVLLYGCNRSAELLAVVLPGTGAWLLIDSTLLLVYLFCLSCGLES